MRLESSAITSAVRRAQLVGARFDAGGVRRCEGVDYPSFAARMQAVRHIKVGAPQAQNASNAVCRGKVAAPDRQRHWRCSRSRQRSKTTWRCSPWICGNNLTACGTPRRKNWAKAETGSGIVYINKGRTRLKRLYRDSLGGCVLAKRIV